MKFIGHDSDIINYLTGDLTLLNAIVKNYKVHEVEGSPTISIMFELAYTEADVMLVFRDVFKNGFEETPAIGQYQIDSCKFYHIGSKVYFSADPDESEEGAEGISEYDNDFILSNHVEGYIFEEETGDR
ncbi:hypothetical protein LLH06_02040 [Mucilaginibacter daejeonensis]|uniref:hypothetical protein n=1 Tax=Mucilaginibacter daejeonensis TaxID=398049 RepID=UPI001D175209|nr:hypothetical protein [Mucilaginibacter daejeonensis]UEG53752.1 hypothetical protein LLH06_02040 [Mucilaginibacter daejeonensis]